MPKSWDEIRREAPVSKRWTEAYSWLADAEQTIAQARHRGGASWNRIEAALAASELTDEELDDEPDLTLTTLTRFVTALGGHLELRAVFEDETIVVLRDP